MVKLVDQMFEMIFANEFESMEQDEIGLLAYHQCVEDSLEGDQMMQPLRNMFNNEEKESITRQEIRDGLTKLLSSNLDDYRELTDNLKAEQSAVM